MRKSILGTGVLILLLVLCLSPIAQYLSVEVQVKDSQNIIAESLTKYRLYKALPEGIEIEPLIELEKAWAIEDERTESDEPLITHMHHDGAQMGYDQETRTFYCTLGMQRLEEWPDLKIYAGGYRFG